MSIPRSHHKGCVWITVREKEEERAYSKAKIEEIPVVIVRNRSCPAVSQICSLILFPSSSIVRILKSILSQQNFILSGKGTRQWYALEGKPTDDNTIQIKRRLCCVRSVSIFTNVIGRVINWFDQLERVAISLWEIVILLLVVIYSNTWILTDKYTKHLREKHHVIKRSYLPNGCNETGGKGAIWKTQEEATLTHTWCTWKKIEEEVR